MLIHEKLKTINDKFFGICKNERHFNIMPKTNYAHNPFDPNEIKLSLEDFNRRFEELRTINEIIKTYKELKIPIKFESFSWNDDFILSYDENGLIVCYENLKQSFIRCLLNDIKYRKNPEMKFRLVYDKSYDEYEAFRIKLVDQIENLNKNIDGEKYKIVTPPKFDDGNVSTIDLRFRKYQKMNKQELIDYINEYEKIFKYIAKIKKESVKITWSIDKEPKLIIHEDKIHIAMNPDYLFTCKSKNSYLYFFEKEFNDLKQELDSIEWKEKIANRRR